MPLNPPLNCALKCALECALKCALFWVTQHEAMPSSCEIVAAKTGGYADGTCETVRFRCPVGVAEAADGTLYVVRIYNTHTLSLSLSLSLIHTHTHTHTSLTARCT